MKVKMPKCCERGESDPRILVHVGRIFEDSVELTLNKEGDRDTWTAEPGSLCPDQGIHEIESVTCLWCGKSLKDDIPEGFYKRLEAFCLWGDTWKVGAIFDLESPDVMEHID